MSYKYYSTQRPIAPGTFPKPDNNKVVGLENFDDRIYCEDIQLYAWGYIEYEKPLTQYDCNSYELIPVKTDDAVIRDALLTVVNRITMIGEESGEFEAGDGKRNMVTFQVTE